MISRQPCPEISPVTSSLTRTSKRKMKEDESEFMSALEVTKPGVFPRKVTRLPTPIKVALPERPAHFRPPQKSVVDSVVDAWRSHSRRSTSELEFVKADSEIISATPVSSKVDSSLKLLWLTIEKQGSALVNDGFGAEAPALSSDNANHPLLGDAHSILADVVGVVGVNVDLFDDADSVDFPDVRSAWKWAGGGDQYLCIAVCPSRRKWAVGAGGKWKSTFRERAAKLALAIALLENCEDVQELFNTWPDFHNLYRSATRSTKPSKKHKKWYDVTAVKPVRDELPSSGVLLDGDEQPSTPITEWRNVPFWIELPEEIPFVPQDLSARLLGVGSKGVGCTKLYSCAEEALAHVAGWAHEDIQYHDDPQWEHFPTVGSALKDILNVEECLVAAVCAPLGVWAIGIGMKARHRYAAAKVALATALAVQEKENGNLLDLAEFPALAAFVEMVPII